MQPSIPHVSLFVLLRLERDLQVRAEVGHEGIGERRDGR
jgi:hypothetical protein